MPEIPRLFGTDGVRARVGDYPLTPEGVRGLGSAIARHFLIHRNVGRFLIVWDTRASGERLSAALADGLSEAGCDVLLGGVLPTGAAAFLAKSRRMGAVVVSASHNPAADNGVKVFTEEGFKLPEAEERLVERLLAEGRRPEPGAKKGAVREDPSLRKDYLAFLTGQANAEVRSFLRSHTIVLDCANGSASAIAPEFFGSLASSPENVISLFSKPDGKNINAGCGALHLSPLVRAVRRSKAALGLAFDGDADRLIAVDEKGQVLNGDRIKAVLASWLKEQGRLAGNIVVSTPYCNLGLKTFLAAIGCSLELVPNGDRQVASRMRERGLSLGGEQSGHIVLMPQSTSGDGLLTAVALLTVIADEGKPLSQLHASFSEYPQCLMNVRVGEKRDLSMLKGVQAAIAEAEKALGPRGRVLVRYSGTENLARVLVEAPSDDEAKIWAERIAEAFGDRESAPAAGKKKGRRRKQR